MADAGYEQPQYGNKEPHGPTYDMVMSEKTPQPGIPRTPIFSAN